MKRRLQFALFLLLAVSAFGYPPERRLFLHFDAANRLTNTTTPLSRVTSQGWNNRGRLQTVIEPSTNTANFYYDARSRLTNRTDGVGTTYYRYDANNNLTTVSEGTQTNTWGFDAYRPRDRFHQRRWLRDPLRLRRQWQRDRPRRILGLRQPDVPERHEPPFLCNGRYGVQTDANGLLCMRSSYYNPYLCQFLNLEPAGFSGGLNFCVAFDGNPISIVDPFGL